MTELQFGFHTHEETQTALEKWLDEFFKEFKIS